MSHLTIGHTVGATPLAHAVVLIKLGDVLGTGRCVPVHVPQEVIQGVGTDINSGHDGVVGAEDIVNLFFFMIRRPRSSTRGKIVL